jgi:hypothetical protein
VTAPEHGAELFKVSLALQLAGEQLAALLDGERMTPRERREALQRWREAAQRASKARAAWVLP